MKISRTLIMGFALICLSLTLVAAPQNDGAKNKEETTVKKETKQTKKTKTKDVKPPETPGGAGMVVSIDPGRGGVQQEPQLSDEMRDALSRMVNTSSEGLTETVTRDGTVIVDLQGRFQSAMVATIGPDGKLQTTCVSKDPKHKHAKSCNVQKKEEKK